MKSLLKVELVGRIKIQTIPKPDKLILDTWISILDYCTEVKKKKKKIGI